MQVFILFYLFVFSIGWRQVCQSEWPIVFHFCLFGYLVMSSTPNKSVSYGDAPASIHSVKLYLGGADPL